MVPAEHEWTAVEVWTLLISASGVAQGFARRLGVPDAEEIVSDAVDIVVMKAERREVVFRAKKSVLSYFFRAVRTRARNARTRTRRLASCGIDEERDVAIVERNPAETALLLDALARVRKAIDGFSEQDKAVVSDFLRGRTLTAIGQEQGELPSAVLRRRRRVFENLRALIGGEP